MNHPMGRSFVALCIVFVTAGCSKAINVPLDQVESVQDPKQRHRIHMKDGTEYAVRRFAVTDSTIVIHDLSPTDIRSDVVSEPIVLSRGSVASVERIEDRHDDIFGVFALLVVLVTIGGAIALGVAF